MSGHRRVKNVDYADDDDGYEDEDFGEEEDLSVEDQEQMRQGVKAVREALGPRYDVSNKIIENGLWETYYDVAQTIEYVKQIAPPPKKSTQPSRFEQAAQAAKAQHGSGAEQSTRKQRASSFDAAVFWEDIKWGEVPEHRLGNIIEILPDHRSHGLLGGSSAGGDGKPSKLAAKIAARRKAQEESRTKTATDKSESQGSNKLDSTASVDILDKYTKRKKQRTDDGEYEPTSDIAESHPTPRSYPVRQKLKATVTEEEDVQQDPLMPATSEEDSAAKSPEPALTDLQGAPSPFARAIFKREYTTTSDTATEGTFFTVPFPHDGKASTNRDPFSGPSPDDVVSKAQSKGTTKTKSSSTRTGTSTPTNGLASDVATMSIDQPSKTRSKNLNVIAEYEKSNPKKSANFVVIGHVDHGKSTLMGRLLYELEFINKRSVDKLHKDAGNMGKSSFAFAWVMDSTEEERERGVTTDIATNHFDTPNTHFTILDAPGHQDFVPNMIAGASQADFAVLVIDASADAFEAGLRGQTKEHAQIARSIGISRIIVAVNKMDTAKWSQDRFDEIKQQLTAFLTGIGYKNEDIAFIPCAGLTGENIMKRPAEPPASMPWYSGRTLVEELDAAEPITRHIKGPLRLTIGDIFRGGSANPLSVSGRLDSGSLQVGDPLVVMPGGESAGVRGLEIDNEPKDYAVAGQIATVHLENIDAENLHQGDILCNPNQGIIRNVSELTIKILAFDFVTPGEYLLYNSRMQSPARVKSLVALLNKTSGEAEKKRPKIIKPGNVARVKVALDNALPLEVPGRVVLRDEGRTIATGLLEEVV